MISTTFSPGTLITAPWLQSVNDFVYRKNYVEAEELGAIGNDVADDGATISNALYLRYNGLATSQRQTYVYVVFNPEKTYKFITPVTIRQNRIKFIGHGATIHCTGAFAFDFTQDGSGNSNEDGAVIGFKITGATTTAIRVRAGNQPEIRDNWITGCVNGLDINAVTPRIHNNYIRDNTGIGLILQSAVLVGGSVGESQAAFITNNRFTGNLGGGWHFIDGVGHVCVGNLLEVNGLIEMRLQNASGCMIYETYFEPKVGCQAVIQIDNTPALLPGTRFADENNFNGLFLGGNAVWDIDVQGGNNNVFDKYRLGTRNVRINAACNNTYLGKSIGNFPILTNGASSTILRYDSSKLGSIKSISSGTTLGNNRSGFVDITGAATTTAVVTFTVNEPDAAYFVTGLVTGKLAGTPASGSYRAHLSTFPTTTGFTIELEAAPGAGNTVRVWWAIER